MPVCFLHRFCNTQELRHSYPEEVPAVRCRLVSLVQKNCLRKYRPVLYSSSRRTSTTVTPSFIHHYFCFRRPESSDTPAITFSSTATKPQKRNTQILACRLKVLFINKPPERKQVVVTLKKFPEIRGQGLLQDFRPHSCPDFRLRCRRSIFPPHGRLSPVRNSPQILWPGSLPPILFPLHEPLSHLPSPVFCQARIFFYLRRFCRCLFLSCLFLLP